MLPRNKSKTLTPSQKIVQSKAFAKAVQKVINRHDPMGLIGEGAPVDEYDYQQAAIMRKLPACKSIDRLQAMIHDEFCHWFNPENAGPPEKYKQPALDLFRLYREFSKTR
jgi:hypothetical protein